MAEKPIENSHISFPCLVTSVGDALDPFSSSKGGWWWRLSRFQSLQTLEMIVTDISKLGIKL